MSFQPDRLRDLRKQKKLSRQQLADKARISLRQLHRLESNSASSRAVRERTITQLADALGVEPGVLTGEQAMPDPAPRHLRSERERVPVSALLLPEVRLAYDLVKRRYGVSPTTIVNLGPLMFTLLAEGSLAWRRGKLTEVRAAAAALCELGNGHLSFAHAGFRASEAGHDEEKSIQELDLFGEEVAEDAYDFGYDPGTNNPFADYLREFASNLGVPNVVEIDPLSNDLHGVAPLKGFPDHDLCNGDLEKISGGSAEAIYALKLGHVRLADIPDQLWAEEAAADRGAWLADQLPDDFRSLLQALHGLGLESTSGSDEAAQ